MNNDENKKELSAEEIIEAEKPETEKIEIKEAVVIQKYLPEMASEEDIRAAVKTKMSELNADIKQMGAVIGAVKSKFGTSADGAVIAKIVKEELNK